MFSLQIHVTATFSLSLTQPLADLFTGCKLFIDSSVPKSQELERYIVRYVFMYVCVCVCMYNIDQFTSFE